MQITFNSKVEALTKVEQNFSQEEIKNETMLFSADYEFARKNGDGLTHLFLDNIPEGWRDSNIIIDTRVHMLMPGWCPCIPGWHHDDVPRDRNGNNQPNYINPEYYAEHLLMVVNADVAPTDFYIGTIAMTLPKERETIVYERWNRELNHIISKPPTEDTPFAILKAADSVIYHFDWQTFHRGTRAVSNGWRFFIRASRYWEDKNFTIVDYQRFNRRTNKNQVRRQVQVYLPEFEKGW